MIRSSIEIRTDILSQVKNGVESPTRLMYMANCNWQQLVLHLDASVEQGLLEYSAPVEGNIRKKKRYRITEKGEEVLSYMNEVRHLAGMENDQRVSQSG